MLYGLKQLRLLARRLKNEIMTLYLAARDPHTPWYAKAVIVCVAAYALSPVDLIPDFIPVLGYLDDLLLLPLGIYLALKLIPSSVLAQAQRKAAESELTLPNNWLAASMIMLLWIAVAFAVAIWFLKMLDLDTHSLIGA